MIACIDPGHGGKDPGAVFNTRRESDDNLRVSLELQRCFEAQNFQVYMTRSRDVDTPFSHRIATEKNAECFISCHRNAGKGRGIEIWLHPRAPDSYIAWAQDIVAGFKTLGAPIRNSMNATRISEGVFKGMPGMPNTPFGVNRDSKSPSMLIEFGFLDNPLDNDDFDKHYKAYADVVTRATCKFLQVPYTLSSSTPPTVPTVPKTEYDKVVAQVKVLQEKIDKAKNALA